jgi:hypothetical protein
MHKEQTLTAVCHQDTGTQESWRTAGFYSVDVEDAGLVGWCNK